MAPDQIEDGAADGIVDGGTDDGGTTDSDVEGGAEGEYCCEACEACFDTPADLREHRRSVGLTY